VSEAQGTRRIAQGTRPEPQSGATAPGRSCPTAYRYSPTVFDRAPELQASSIYVVGGLYGNLEALAALEKLVEREPGARIVFNGDFHWFDADTATFADITERVLGHPALRGNVETEIAAEDSGAGCGCAYPMDVSDAEVARSNEILERLRETARTVPAWRERLRALPMHLAASVDGIRVGIVHGDASSLAGWGFAHDQLGRPSHLRWIESMFRQAKVQVFASTHTCLPALRTFAVDGRDHAIVNNGAAGMPNFAGTRHGLVTRLASHAFQGGERLHGTVVAGLHVDILRLEYDHARWVSRFLAQWPEGSAAHASYFRRIVEGPRFAAERLAA
jgi:hypothetical protein